MDCAVVCTFLFDFWNSECFTKGRVAESAAGCISVVADWLPTDKFPSTKSGTGKISTKPDVIILLMANRRARKQWILAALWRVGEILH